MISTPAASAAGSNLWFTIVSLFPPTYDNTANGLRIDLMQELAGLNPGYMRIPGGNYLEGDTIDTRFDWEDTVGPIQDRPGHFNSAWGYWSQDGMGLLEYLELAEELHASPVLAVWAGYTLTGTVVPQSQLEPYVQSALDEIQYAIGPTTTYWGAQRAADGHPAPFDLSMVEIGNEDFFDGSGSYNAYRYPMFANAIRAAYPQLKLIATTPVTNGPVDIVDEHYYNNDPQYFAENAHIFDSVSRSGPKVIVGEYATTNGTPTGTLANAVGEAAFLTGTERNSDLVLGASYAPLLVNVNAPSWPTNLIGYNALKSYVSPSYWAQEMLSTQHGDHVIGSQLVSGSGTLFDVASQGNGHTYVAVVNDGSAPARIHDLAGRRRRRSQRRHRDDPHRQPRRDELAGSPQRGGAGDTPARLRGHELHLPLPRQLGDGAQPDHRGGVVDQRDAASGPPGEVQVHVLAGGAEAAADQAGAPLAAVTLVSHSLRGGELPPRRPTPRLARMSARHIGTAAAALAAGCIVAATAEGAVHGGRTTQHAVARLSISKRGQLQGLIVTLSASCSDKRRRRFTPGFAAPFARPQTKSGYVSDHYNILGHDAATGARFRERASFSAHITPTRVTGTAQGTLTLLPGHTVCTSPTVHFAVHL